MKWEIKSKKWYGINVQEKEISRNKPIQFSSVLFKKMNLNLKTTFNVFIFFSFIFFPFFFLFGNFTIGGIKNSNVEISHYFTILTDSTWQWESKNGDVELGKRVCRTLWPRYVKGQTHKKKKGTNVEKWWEMEWDLRQKCENVCHDTCKYLLRTLQNKILSKIFRLLKVFGYDSLRTYKGYFQQYQKGLHFLY